MSRAVVRSSFALIAMSGAALSAQKPASATTLIAAADLPIIAMHLREDGVPSSDLQRAFDAMRTKRMPASEARDVMNEERNAVRTRGPVDNFGAFVQSKLDAGLRGRALASAIRAEHAARGKGRGNRGTVSAGNSRNRGNATKSGRPAASARRGADSSVLHGAKSAPNTRATKSAKPPATKAPASKASATKGATTKATSTKGRSAASGSSKKPNF